MDNTRTSVKKFIYSQYLSNGVRQSVGVLLPPFVLIGIFDEPVVGMAAAFGALCVATIDQPGPHQHRLNSMLGCVVLGTLAALITGVSTSWPALLLAVVVLQTFVFGLFSAFGRKGGLIGFACLLLMTLTLHTAITPQAAMWHALATLCGGLWYTAFSMLAGKLSGLRQERQALAVGIFATAEYIEAKAAFYDVGQDLPTVYRALVPKQSALAEKQQAARDLVLRIVPRSAVERTDRERVLLSNIFIDMVDLQETMLATYTDYDVLRHALADSDLLLFARDALRKLAREVDDIGMAVARNRPLRRSALIKAELRAMEYETVLLKKAGFPQSQPEAWVVVVQVLRRLRTAARMVARMQQHTQSDAVAPEQLMRADSALSQFISRDEISLKRLTSNLTLRSPHMRYALRLALAVGAGLLAAWGLEMAAHRLGIATGGRSDWVILTILVIMKPGFALSWQRNRWRLAGTLIGCALTIALMNFTQNPVALLCVMLLASILSNSLVVVAYMASSVFNTILVLLSFHFLSPGSLIVVGERAIDALIASLLVWACSYVLPYWENRSILPLARKAIGANRRFLEVCRTPPAGTSPTGVPEVRNDLTWRLARRDAHAAFSNFADAFYRMMMEPKSKRIATLHLNDLLVQNHMLASQIAATGPLMRAIGEPDRHPAELTQVFLDMENALTRAEDRLLEPAPGPQPAHVAPTAEPPVVTTDALHVISRALEPLAQKVQNAGEDPGTPVFETAHLTYQLRQMIRTVQRIHDDAFAVQAGPGVVPELSAQRAEPLIVPQR